ncbi:MAG: hypothetical protein ACLFWM_10810 [Actinomycetota bacterium]
MIRRMIVWASVVALVGATASVAAASPRESADLFGQGMDGPTVSADGAKIHRTAKGVSASVTMPTPAPGSYVYPEGPTASGVSGHPEAFSLWVFVFFNPEACDGECGAPDLATNPDVVAGAFNAGGHLVGGPHLTISGKANHNSPTFGPPEFAETIGEALDMGYEIADAEIHLAVAPHGALAPELLPSQIKTPAGNPSHWWFAVFE